jgi:hypothetical protein
MRPAFLRIGLAVVITALLVLAVSCDDKSTTEKQKTACDELAKFDASLQKLQNIGANASINDLKSARDDVKKQATKAREAVREYNQSKAQDLQNAVDNLDKAVKNISGNDTIAQAKASIQPEIMAVQAARDKLRTDLNCPKQTRTITELSPAPGT